MTSIERIVAELIELDPSLKGHEQAVTSVVARLMAEKPNISIDRAFLDRLRKEIVIEAHQSRTAGAPWTTWTMRFAYSGVALAVLLVAAVTVLPGSLGRSRVDLGISTKPTIRVLAANSFGEFASTLNVNNTNLARPQSGGGLGAGAPVAQGVAEDAKIAAPSSTDLSIAPVPYVPTIVKYDFPGETLENLAAEGTVYRRVRTSLAPKFSGLLGSIDLALLRLSSFSGLQLTRLEFTDDKKPGYSIFADLMNGEIAINSSNYPISISAIRPPTPNGHANMDDASALALASSFLSEHGVDTSGYGEPVVVRPEAPKGADAGSWLSVRYPIVVDGLKVYDYGGEATGLTVNMDGSQQRVESVYGLASYEFESSKYPLVTDPARIIAAAEKGYFGTQYFAEGQAVKERTHTLGTPEMILYRNWQYSQDGSQSGEYLVPALMFPVIDRNVAELDEPWLVQKNVIVPLSVDVLNQLESPPQPPLLIDPMPAVTEPAVRKENQ